MKTIKNYKAIITGLIVFCGALLFVSDSNAVVVEFANPLKYSTVEGFLTAFLNVLQGLIVLISVVFIVVGGILYMTSAGNEERIGTAKKAVTASLVGLAIGVAAPTFVKEIYIMLGASEVPGEVQGAIGLMGIITNVLNFLLGIMGVLAVVMLVSAGIMYLTSAGDETRIETAKKMTKWSIIGVAIALGAMIIVRQIVGFFV